MKEKLMMVALIFSLTVNAAVLLTMGYFWGRNQSGRHSSENAVPRPMSAELSLDREQRERMRALREAFMVETAPVRENLRVKRTELATLLSAEEPERFAAEQKLREINDLQLQMQIAVIDQLFKEKQFLSPEQRERYADFISRNLCRDFLTGRKGYGGHRGRGMGRREGNAMGMGEGGQMRGRKPLAQ